MMKTTTVEAYILNSGEWQSSLNMLREIMLALEMEETVKWGIPVYCVKGINVVGLVSFKSYTGMWFYQGVFLEDKHKKLLASEEETRGQRQWRFDSADQIEKEVELIVEYVKEAIQNALSGKKIIPTKNKPFDVPEELLQAFLNDPELKKHYDLLSYSKRRDYARYIGQAKRPETRKRRLEKSIPMIREGKGLMDVYNKPG